MQYRYRRPFNDRTFKQEMIGIWQIN